MRFKSNIIKERQEIFRIYVLDKDQIEAKFCKYIPIITKSIQRLNSRSVNRIA